MESLIKYLKLMLEEKIGIDPKMINNSICTKILQERMKITGIAGPELYFSLLKESSKELQALIELVVIPETWFFRDRESIDFLVYKVYSEYFRSDKTQNVRILSLACSTGEEPYSLVMALADIGMPLNQIRITGIDINAKSLKIAESGIYRSRSFRNNCNLIIRERYFNQQLSTFKIKQFIKDSVEFSIGNVFDPLFYLPYQGYDFIFCRNLLIYLSIEAQKILIKLLNKTLKPGGYLFTAPSEMELIKGNGFIQHLPQRTCAFKKTSAEDKAKTTSAQGKVCSLKPNNDHAEEKSELEKAKLLANAGNFDQSILQCLDYITKYGIKSEISFLLGLIHHAKGNEETAEDYFQKTLYLDPFHHEALVYMSLLAQKRGDHKQAERFMSRAEQSAPQKAVRL